MQYFWKSCPFTALAEEEQTEIVNISWHTVTAAGFLVDGTEQRVEQRILPDGSFTLVGEELTPLWVEFESGLRLSDFGAREAVVPARYPDPEDEYIEDFLAYWQQTENPNLVDKGDNYWRCGCGQVNPMETTDCKGCGLYRKRALRNAEPALVHSENVRFAKKRAREAELWEDAAHAKLMHRRRMTRIGVGVGGVFVLAAVILLLFFGWVIPARHVAKAKALVEVGRLYEAYTEYVAAKGYGDAEQQRIALSQKMSSETILSAGDRHVVRTNRMYKAEGVGYVMDTQLMVDKWNALVAVSAGADHTLGLHHSGTVLAVGKEKTGALNVGHWAGVTAVAAGDGFSLGLKEDGTLYATGKNGKGQCNVRAWKDITAIAAGRTFSLGLKSDGTVVATGDNSKGQCEVSDWKNVMLIVAGGDHAMALTKDGKVLSAGNNAKKACDTAEWENIIALAAGDGFSIGLKKDGSLVACGDNARGQIKVEGYKDIIAVTAGKQFAILLDKEGTPHYLGTDADGESKVDAWNLAI